MTLEKNPNAFRPKIASSPQKPEVSMVSSSIQLSHVFIVGVFHQSFELKFGGVNAYYGVSWYFSLLVVPFKCLEQTQEEVSAIQLIGRHNKGCHCKKGCLKKYCECFHANVPCSENCKCIGCKNFEGNDEWRIVLQIRQATNAAINQAVGLGPSISGTHITPKKRKIQESFSGKSLTDQTVSMTAQHLQVLLCIIDMVSLDLFNNHLVTLSVVGSPFKFTMFGFKIMWN